MGNKGKRKKKMSVIEAKKQKVGVVVKTDTETAPRVTSHSSQPAGHDPRAMLEWLIAPVSVETFMSEYWEKKPLVINRNNPDYYKGLFTKDDVDHAVKEGKLEYGSRINVVKYFADKGRVKFNKEGVAQFEDIDNFWKKGCTLQVMHPQQYMDNVWRMNSALEDFFGCLVGSNSYLTPAGSQGLAPHFDDVEVFVLQLEGSKKWILCDPPMELPREYSPDFTQDQIGAPVLKPKLHQGDFMYFPRGQIHQARAAEVYSHHLTLSTYQTTSWFDFLSSAIPSALDKAFRSDIDFRRGLPVNFFRYMGFAHSKNPNEQNKKFQEQFWELWNKLPEFVDADQTADSLAVDFTSYRLPPPPNALPSINSNEGKLAVKSRVRLINPAWLRMVVDFDEQGSPELLLFHCLLNSRDNNMDGRHEPDPECMKMQISFAPALAHLFSSYPNFVALSSLPVLTDADKEAFANSLQEEALLEVEQE